jgi:metal-responsive CopG/Arc/MetJ family transcriptional regulator
MIAKIYPNENSNEDDIMISVRMPIELYKKLKEYEKSNHYIDTSEAVRSIIRKKYSEMKNPLMGELRGIKKMIIHKMENDPQSKVIKEIEELKRLLEGME